MYEKGERLELAAKEKEEWAVIQAYLPGQLSQEEGNAVVSAVIAEIDASSMKDMGRVMKEAMARLKGKTDGKLVQQIVRLKVA